MNKKNILKVVCFFAILAALMGIVQYFLQYRERNNDNSSFQIINFYKEKRNSADAVFVGSSCCFSFYSPLFAYNAHDIKTLNYASSGMGMISYRYVVEEVRKKQKDALIVLTITPNDEMSYLGLHFITDYMPLSTNKINLFRKYFSQEGESLLNSIGFFFTLWEYHDRWSELDCDDFVIDDGTKGATQHKYYLSYVNDISSEYITTNKKEPLSFVMDDSIKELLDYCDENNERNIVFLFPPRVYDEIEYGQLNTLVEYIVDRGYKVLDLRNKTDELGLDLENDFYDKHHTNIHGSIKYTDYLAKYVMDIHECEHEKDSKWDRALDKYTEIIGGYVLDVENDTQRRNFSLSAPILISLEHKGDNLVLSWEKEDGVEGYRVYRKEDGAYTCIGETSMTYFEDDSCEIGHSYTYTAIAYANGKYGNYDYVGLTAEAGK